MARHSSRIELSQSALRNNINFIRQKVGPAPVISSVIKANAFGHGVVEFVPMAEKCGIRHFSVASSFEAREVLAVCSAASRIMIMGILYDEDMPWVVANDIEFFVFNLERLEVALAAAKALGKQAVVHLELETGGNRTGLTETQLIEAVEFIKKHRASLQFEGICTHYAGIESLANQFRTTRQLETFRRLYQKVAALGYLPAKRHTACSAAALAFPETVMDMVRIGTAQYGLWPSPDIYQLHLLQVGKTHDNPLRRVITWKTDVMHIKAINKGDYVGYGTSFRAPRDMTIAVLPLGYANGYDRELSNKGHVLIKGKKAPVVGLVNMNMFMVDISRIPNVQLGDEVVLVGRQRNSAITIGSFSDTSKLINNEFLSRLPATIPRACVR